jgi:hypothetical protein
MWADVRLAVSRKGPKILGLIVLKLCNSDFSAILALLRRMTQLPALPGNKTIDGSN